MVDVLRPFNHESQAVVPTITRRIGMKKLFGVCKRGSGGKTASMNYKSRFQCQYFVRHGFSVLS